MAEAKVASDQLLATVEELERADQIVAGQMGAVVLEGMRRGAAVISDICDEYLRLRQTQSLDEMNPKVARMGLDASMGMLKLGGRFMSEAFQRRRDDSVTVLLEELRVARSVREEKSD